jgi:hypothetical protein
MAWLLLLGLFLQTGIQAPLTQPEPAVQDLLNPTELRALQRSANLPARIQALLGAAGRHLKAADQSLKADNSQGLQNSLDAYGRILQACEWHMHSRGPGKPPNLKKQEITLRKYIASLEDMQAKADLDDKPPFKEAIRASSALRTHFLKTFFGSGSLKQQ